MQSTFAFVVGLLGHYRAVKWLGPPTRTAASVSFDKLSPLSRFLSQ